MERLLSSEGSNSYGRSQSTGGQIRQEEEQNKRDNHGTMLMRHREALQPALTDWIFCPR
jgi:hypothetical protein